MSDNEGVTVADPHPSERVLAVAVSQLRGVFSEIEDPTSELTATVVTRRRIEGAVFTLEAMRQGSAVGSR